MDRKMLVELFRDGMRYPKGKHQLWVSRCFEITVHPNEVIELNEYEAFATEQARGDEMFHVGRSVVDLKAGRVIEQSGEGWPEKKLDK